jgi:chromosome partitioning protein
MIITVCNGKGGAGKTTLAVLLALAWTRLGRAPALLDCDPQQTATRWLAALGESLSASGDNPTGDPLIIDTPPLLTSPALHEALRQSDLVLLVSSASPADLWSSQNTAAVVREHLRPAARAFIVFNQIQKNALLARDLGHLAERIGLPMLPHYLPRRQSFQHAALLGWRALDRRTRDLLIALATDLVASAPAAPNPSDIPTPHDQESRTLAQT